MLTPDSLCVCAAPFVGMNFLRLMWLAIAYAITQFGITAVSLSSDMLANASSGAHGLCTVTMSVVWSAALPVSCGRCAEALKLLRRLSTSTLSLWVSLSQSFTASIRLLTPAEERERQNTWLNPCLCRVLDLMMPVRIHAYSV